MTEFKKHQKKALTELRSYEHGEDMTGITVSEQDAQLETLDGGYIAKDPNDHNNQWYVSKSFYDANYEEAIPVQEALQSNQDASLTTSSVVGLLKPEGVEQSVWDAWVKTAPVPAPFAPSSGVHNKKAVDDNGVPKDDSNEAKQAT